jgi:hypothetical protein
MSSEFEHFFELEITQNSTKFDQNFSSLLFLSQQRTFLLSSLKRSGSGSERVIGEGSECATTSKTPRQQQTIPGSGAQRAAASVEVNF